MTDLVQLIRSEVQKRRDTGAPSFVAYTERDGGPWYVVAGERESWWGEQRIAEGFDDREDAQRFLLWMLGGSTSGEAITRRTGTLSAEFETGLVWCKEAARVFPDWAAVNMAEIDA